MIQVEQFMHVKQLDKEGHSIRDIARITGLSRNTVRKVLRGEHDLKARPACRSSKLDPYKDYLRRRYEEHGLSAVRLLGEIRPMGYGGSVVTLRRFLATLRTDRRRQGRLTVRFETPPGKQAQADWAYCGRHPHHPHHPHHPAPDGGGGRGVAIYAFVMVLSFSRMLFVQFTTLMKMAQLVECHQRAFDFFGGVPAILLYDNMKQVRAGPGRFNEQLLDFANHYGFAPKTHRPYRPRTKGKVERSVDYVKDNFLAGRAFGGLDDLNAQAAHWLEQTANVRLHGTTGRRPIDLFEQERRALTPVTAIAPYRFVDPVRRTASYESSQFRGSRYSVPPGCAGRSVEVAAEGGMILVRLGDAIVVEHREAARPGQRIVQREHLAELWKITQQQVRVPADAPRWRVSFDQAVQITPLATFEEVVGEGLQEALP